jgi:hypothetical protein
MFSTRLAAACVAVLAAGGTALADWVPGKRMNEAMVRIMAAGTKNTDQTEYGFDRDVCMCAGFVQVGKSVGFNRSFVAGSQYLLLGGGDDNARDIDLEVFDSSGEKIAADTDDDPAPVVRFTPKKSGTYSFRLTLHKAGNPKAGGFCAAVVLRKGGYGVPVVNLSKALGGLAARAESVDQKTKKKVYFHDGDNQWCLFGSVLPAGDSLSISGMRLPVGEYVAIGAGDTVGKDVDLYVLDSAGSVAAKDEDDDPVPVVPFTVSKGGVKAGLKAKNVKSNGPSLTLFALLKIVD